MNQDQKTGAVIIIVAVVLMVVTLVLSQGWEIPGVSLYLFAYGDVNNLNEYVVIWTRHVLAVLIFIAGYGVARYLSVIPSIFRKRQQSETKDKES